MCPFTLETMKLTETDCSLMSNELGLIIDKINSIESIGFQTKKKA